MTLLKTFLVQTAVIADRFFINKRTGCGETGARSGVGQLHKSSWQGLVSGKACVGGQSNRHWSLPAQGKSAVTHSLYDHYDIKNRCTMILLWQSCCQTDSLFFARYHCAGGKLGEIRNGCRL